MTSSAHGQRERSDARSNRLTVASYNLHSCVGWDGKRSPARIAEVLRELDCDIYALQEVDNQPGEHEESMQLEYLSNALDMAAVPGLRIVRHTGEYGNALLTRLPIVHVRRHDLSYSRAEPRGALDVELDLRGRPLRIIATHLGLRRSERRFQWHRLMVAIGEGSMEMPLIVIGDMNEWYRGAATLREAHLAFGEPPAPPGFPSFAPLLALTRIWVRPRSAIESVVIHRSALARQASDHLPLKAVLDVSKLHA
ncbi:MAG TPA: endonuclease/exonuclease/phosphatase family protein [Steroidobacteraceae bacterium]